MRVNLTQSDKVIKITWNDLMKIKRTYTEPVPKRDYSFYKAEITTFHGIVQFTGPNSVRIIKNDYGENNNDKYISNNQNKFCNKKKDNHGYEKEGKGKKISKENICRFLNLKHHLHSSFEEKSIIIERTMQYIKDNRTKEIFDDTTSFHAEEERNVN